jgi:hypothetical protein
MKVLLKDEGLLHSQRTVRSDALRFAQEQQSGVSRYLNPGETVQGFGHGGSESLTMFIANPRGERIVRKVLSERLVTASWRRDGKDVMLPPCTKARRQVEYLRGLPESAKPYFPNILERSERSRDGDVQEFIYDMSYVPGVEVSRAIQRYRPPARIVASLYAEIFKLLKEKIHVHRQRVPARPTLEQSYFKKIEKRLVLANETAPRTFSERLLLADEILVNGRLLRSVPALLRAFRESERYREVLEPRTHGLVVGDTNTENIKIGNVEPLLHDAPFTAEELQIRFLDPRAIGYHENGVDTGADDPMYDNKPWHNSIGHYDQIHGEHFDLGLCLQGRIPSIEISFHQENPYAASYGGIERYFASAMKSAYDDPFWIVRFVFLMGTHFMAMPPFHFSRTANGELKDHVFYQSRPIAIYVEGIRWLNLALEMLEGNVKSFLGVPVPRIP